MQHLLLSWNLFGGLEDFLGNWFVQGLGNILSFIPKIVYFIVACLLSIVDFFQVAFRKLAGLDTVIVSGEAYTGDPIYKIIVDALIYGKYPAIATAFWSLIILGVLMLIVISIIAVIRNEYKPDKEKGTVKSGVVKNFILALFYFAIMPIAAIFGMYLGNVLISTIDTVVNTQIVVTNDRYTYFDTQVPSDDDLLVGVQSSYIAYDVFGLTIPTASEPFSGMVFKASAYTSNRFRLYGDEYLAQVQNSGTTLGIFNSGTITTASEAADVIDTAFAINAKMKGNTTYSLSSDGISSDYYTSGWVRIGGSTNALSHFSKYNPELVYYFYDLWIFNYVIAFVAITFLSKFYLQYCLALMTRMFEVFALFLFSPVAISVMPLDSSVAGRWSKTFFTKFSLLLFMVFALDAISPLLVVTQNIKLFNAPMLDYIVTTLFIIAGVNAIDAISKTAANVASEKGGDAMGKALEQSAGVIDSARSGLNLTKQAAGVATFVPRMAGRAVGARVKRGVGDLAGNIGGAIDRRRENRFDQQTNDYLANNFDNEDNSIRASETARIEADNVFDSTRRSQYVDNFRRMTSDDRADAARDFLATEAGRRFADTNYGGNASAALNALRYDEKPGRSIDIGDAQREEFAEFLHTRDMYNQTAAAAESAPGSAGYRQGLNQFSNLSEHERAARLADENPTARQQQIRTQRQQYTDQRETEKQQYLNRGRENRRNFVGTVIGGVQRGAGELRQSTGALINSAGGGMIFFGKSNKK